MKLLNKAGEMPSLKPPEDESITTLYIGGLDARINEQDLRDTFYSLGEIESIKIVIQRACAFVTYTTREAAEKAAEELHNKLVIKGLRLKLMWGRPQVPKPKSEVLEEARQQAVRHNALLPRAVISQQQNQIVQPPGTQHQPAPPVHYYPSMDPQRMGAVIPSRGENSGGSNDSRSDGSEKLQGQHYPSYSGMPPPQAQIYQPFYPSYGYTLPPPQPYQQNATLPYHSPAPPLGPGIPQETAESAQAQR